MAAQHNELADMPNVRLVPDSVPSAVLSYRAQVVSVLIAVADSLDVHPDGVVKVVAVLPPGLLFTAHRSNASPATIPEGYAQTADVVAAVVVAGGYVVAD
jgi:hypothetical protein